MAYADFQNYSKDPMYIVGIIAGHFLLILVAAGFIVPKWFNWFIPIERFDDGKLPYAPGIPRDAIEGERADNAMETGSNDMSPSSPASKEKKVEDI